MCKELKRLTDLSQCMQLSKTARDACTWAIYQIEPPEVSPDKGFDGFDFTSWPVIPDKKVFTELVKARKAKKKVIMNQAYIELAGPHLHELVKSNVTVNEALKIATIGGWQGFKANWILNEIKANDIVDKTEHATSKDYVELVKSGVITAVNQIPAEYRMTIETHLKLGSYKPETLDKLSRIGFAI